MLAMTWVVAKMRWDTVDVADPRRAFVTEVFTTVQARMPRFSRNGGGSEPNRRWTWNWRQKPDTTAQKQDENGESDR
jgi:hypothetical protein